MSWLFSQALVAAYSPDNCSDGTPSAQLNVMPTPQLFWRNDKMTDCSIFSRFGLTSQPLTADRGEVVLTSYLVAFPVRISVRQDRGGGHRCRAQRTVGGNGTDHSPGITTICLCGKLPSSHFSGTRTRSRRPGRARVQCGMGSVGSVSRWCTAST